MKLSLSLSLRRTSDVCQLLFMKLDMEAYFGCLPRTPDALEFVTSRPLRPRTNYTCAFTLIQVYSLATH